MSVAEITGRIAQIQAQLAMLVPPGASTGSATSLAAARVLGGTATTGSTEFADWLAQSVATDDLGTNAGASPTSASQMSGQVSGARVVAEAQRYIGLPYVWGGDDPGDGGMDCSGLVQHVYSSLGIDLPRVSADQARAGAPVPSMAEAQPGDLIAWDNSGRNVGADHIAIYIGGGKMIEAPRTGLDIRVTDVAETPDYIRRVLPSTISSRTSAEQTPYADLFADASARHGVSSRLLAAVARQESSFDASAVSPAGAQGLMQLMPGTAAGLGVDDPFDPAQAVDGAARLLKQLLERFGSVDLALAGYNAGPGAVLRYDGVPPYPETQNYVRSIMAQLDGSGAL